MLQQQFFDLHPLNDVNLLCQNKKSYKKVTFLVAQKIRHIQPGAGYEKDIFFE